MKKILLVLLPLLLSCSTTSSPRLDARYQVDSDQKPIPQPEEGDFSELWDQPYNHFFRPIYQSLFIPNIAGDVEAENVNAWDEVPDSSWFTNRISRADREWAMKDVVQGPRDGGPNMSGPWRIVRGKVDGVTPGFTIKDANDDMYFIKFDPPGFQELGSAAEVISSLIMHSAGFNVPANYAMRVPMAKFVLDPKAKVKGKRGKKRLMTEEDFFKVLGMVELDELETVRIVASRALPGRPVGPFSYEGTRSDDPNDDIPHENRREVRGFHVFSAWLNNTDVRFQNTLDMYQGKSPNGYVKHFWLDFGTSLGSSGDIEKNIRSGYEYAVDFGVMAYNFVTLGVHKEYWKDVQSSTFSSVGTFESKVFDPRLWRPQYSNQAFASITERDGFWASKIIMSFTEKQIARIVSEANYSNPQAKAYMTRILIERQRKMGQSWFRNIAPTDDFHLEGETLSFIDLAEKYSLYDESRRYENRESSTSTACTLRNEAAWSCPVSSLESLDLALIVNGKRTKHGTRLQFADVNGKKYIQNIERY